MVAVSPWRLRFELAGTYWGSSTATLPGSPPEGASLELATLGIRAGYLFSGRDFAFAPLVGVEGDRMAADGFGGTSRSNQTATWVAVDAGATGSWSPFHAFHAVSLSLTLEAVVPTEKLPAFVATEPGGAERTVQQASQVAARAFLGVEYRFL